MKNHVNNIVIFPIQYQKHAVLLGEDFAGVREVIHQDHIILTFHCKRVTSLNHPWPLWEIIRLCGCFGLCWSILNASITIVVLQFIFYALKGTWSVMCCVHDPVQNLGNKRKVCKMFLCLKQMLFYHSLWFFRCLI